ncbi:MAG: hypothetical protein ACPG4U_04340 [Pseudomonadales bacterium]
MEADKIDTFSLYYNELEDRIKLSVELGEGVEDMHFWLTRRLSLRLLDATVDLLQQTSRRVSKTPYEHRSAMALFEHQVAQLNQARTLSEAVRDNTKVEGEINILRRLDISFHKRRYKLSFFLNDTSNAVASTVIGSQALHQLVYLIHTGATALDWGVDKLLFTTEDEQKRVLQ